MQTRQEYWRERGRRDAAANKGPLFKRRRGAIVAPGLDDDSWSDEEIAEAGEAYLNGYDGGVVAARPVPSEAWILIRDSEPSGRYSHSSHGEMRQIQAAEPEDQKCEFGCCTWHRFARQSDSAKEVA